jgi:hypothetical protein
MKVCWQVTGIRKDKWAEAHPLEVEQEKPEEEQGCYLHPELYGEPEERRIGRPASEERQQVEERKPPQPPLSPHPSLPPSFDSLARPDEERHRQTIEELRRLVEEQQRQIEELTRRMEGQEGEPPEAT